MAVPNRRQRDKPRFHSISLWYQLHWLFEPIHTLRHWIELLLAPSTPRMSRSNSLSRIANRLNSWLGKCLNFSSRRKCHTNWTASISKLRSRIFRTYGSPSLTTLLRLTAFCFATREIHVICSNILCGLTTTKECLQPQSCMMQVYFENKCYRCGLSV